MGSPPPSIPEPCEHDGCCACSDLRSYIPHYARLLAALEPSIVYEWGPGPNTGMAIDAGANVVSMEQNRRWIPEELADGLMIRHANVESPFYASIRGFEDADLYFVDSRRRAECLRSIWQWAWPEAIACIHDATRPRYRASILAFEFVRFLEPGFAVMTRSAESFELLAAL